jgi:hypothetical protein
MPESWRPDLGHIWLADVTERLLARHERRRADRLSWPWWFGRSASCAPPKNVADQPEYIPLICRSRRTHIPRSPPASPRTATRTPADDTSRSPPHAPGKNGALVNVEVKDHGCHGVDASKTKKVIRARQLSRALRSCRTQHKRPGTSHASCGRKARDRDRARHRQNDLAQPESGTALVGGSRRIETFVAVGSLLAGPVTAVWEDRGTPAEKPSSDAGLQVGPRLWKTGVAAVSDRLDERRDQLLAESL